MKRRPCRLNQTPRRGNKRNPPTYLCWTIRSVTQLGHLFYLDSHYHGRRKKSYNAVQCRHSKNMYLLMLVPYGHLFSPVMACLLIALWGKASYILSILIFQGFVLALADSLRCAWFIYPIWCWYRCPEIGTRSIDGAQLNRFYLKTKTKSSIRNVVF
jgi:hypothetical protein